MPGARSSLAVPRRTGIPALAFLASLWVGTPASAGPSIAQFPKDAAKAPAVRYAALGRAACLRELRRRKIRFRAVGAAPGVLAPVRLEGKLGGVSIHTDFPVKKRRTVPWEVFDCRLVLAVHDFTRILAAHDIDEVHIFSAWRPPGKRWPAGKLGKRHPGGLAVDVRAFKKRSGEELVVERDFHGRIGAETCGAEAATPEPATPEALELRAIACEAADARLFNGILTPNYNEPHRNHFHLDVAAGVKWFIVR